jgi:hypothetical protein
MGLDIPLSAAFVEYSDINPHVRIAVLPLPKSGKNALIK